MIEWAVLYGHARTLRTAMRPLRLLHPFAPAATSLPPVSTSRPTAIRRGRGADKDGGEGEGEGSLTKAQRQLNCVRSLRTTRRRTTTKVKDKKEDKVKDNDDDEDKEDKRTRTRTRTRTRRTRSTEHGDVIRTTSRGWRRRTSRRRGTTTRPSPGPRPTSALLYLGPALPRPYLGPALPWDLPFLGLL